MEYRRSPLLSIVAVFLICCSIPIFCIGVALSDTAITGPVIFALWLGLVFYNFKRDNAMMLAFLLTFFMFLLGELFINQFDETALHASTMSSLLHAHICIYIALMGFHFGTLLGKKKFVFGSYNSNKYSALDSEATDFTTTEKCLAIRKACKVLYIVFGGCSLAVACERLFLSLEMGSYTETFINYSSSLPGIVTKFAGMSDMVFFLFLATLPDPKKSKLVIGLKVLVSVILLIYGTRSSIMMTMIILAIYCIYYENLNNEEYSIIPRWIYVAACISLPYLLLFFDFLMAYRDGRSYSFIGLVDSVKHIVSSVGGSVNVITYGYETQSTLPNKIYSFGGVIDFFTQNIIARSIFGAKQYGGNTVEMALYGNSFSNALTYLVKNSAYLRGYGMGSSYIAEAFHDFGYIGVGLFSIVYGKILSVTKKLSRASYIKNALVLMAAYYILIAPRAYADGFISCFLNFSFILTVFMVYILTSFFRSR